MERPRIAREEVNPGRSTEPLDPRARIMDTVGETLFSPAWWDRLSAGEEENRIKEETAIKIIELATIMAAEPGRPELGNPKEDRLKNCIAILKSQLDDLLDKRGESA